ncbi:MAG: 50S ribosomal protein L32 [Candidatus Wildermuthbacteria bacterium]|nr:50S ribosomal protein L32 [Candidatus Wildermuthbacteria bacterium]
MAVPKNRRSKGRQGQRRMHLHLRAKNIAICSHCKKEVLSHTVCPNCGFYKGREILTMLDMKEKKKKQEAKQSS